MKKIIVIASFVLIALASIFVVNENILSKENLNIPTPEFKITVYQVGGTTTQANAEVEVTNSSGNIIATGTTNSNGYYAVPSWSQPTGTYTVKAWYPARPLDGQFGQTSVYYSGSSVYPNITLGANY